MGWYLQRDIHIGDWNGMENAEIDPHKYAQLIFGPMKKNSVEEGESYFQQMVLDLHKVFKKPKTLT